MIVAQRWKNGKIVAVCKGCGTYTPIVSRAAFNAFELSHTCPIDLGVGDLIAAGVDRMRQAGLPLPDDCEPCAKRRKKLNTLRVGIRRR